MITSKQRAKLRSMANELPTTVQIGKNGITDLVIGQVREAILPNELIKLQVLETAMLTAREAAQSLADRINAEIVQVIGARFVLYKANPDEPVIQI